MDAFFQSIISTFNFGDISLVRILTTLILTFVLGLYIFWIYRKTFAGVIYSRNFGVALVMLCMVTGMIIMPITSNLTLSLGMVGALSIVRFRTAVKDPIDTIYMFWAIAVGIMVGARFFLPAVVCSVLIGILLLVLSVMKLRKAMPYILVLRYAERAGVEVQRVLGKLPKGNLKSKTVTVSGVELTIEMRLKEEDLQIVDRFLEIDDVYDAALISHGGDIVA